VYISLDHSKFVQLSVVSVPVSSYGDQTSQRSTLRCIMKQTFCKAPVDRLGGHSKIGLQ
jgi:hypothetical protein